MDATYNGLTTDILYSFFFEFGNKISIKVSTENNYLNMVTTKFYNVLSDFNGILCSFVFIV